jgi:hypothetical protein
MSEAQKSFEELCSLGFSQFQHGNDEEAISTFEKAVSLAQKLGDRVMHSPLSLFSLISSSLFDFEVIANFFIMFLTHVPLLYIQLLIL